MCGRGPRFVAEQRFSTVSVYARSSRSRRSRLFVHVRRYHGSSHLSPVIHIGGGRYSRKASVVSLIGVRKCLDAFQLGDQHVRIADDVARSSRVRASSISGDPVGEAEDVVQVWAARLRSWQTMTCTRVRREVIECSRAATI